MVPSEKEPPEDLSAESLRSLSGIDSYKGEDDSDTVKFGKAELSFLLPAQSYSEIKMQLGFGSFEEWCDELKISRRQATFDCFASPAATAFFPFDGELRIIGDGRYKLIVAVRNDRHYFFGRIWDTKRETTWAIQGQFDALSELDSMINRIIPLAKPATDDQAIGGGQAC